MILIITLTYTNISIDNARCNYNRSTGIGIEGFVLNHKKSDSDLFYT